MISCSVKCSDDLDRKKGQLTEVLVLLSKCARELAQVQVDACEPRQPLISPGFHTECWLSISWPLLTAAGNVWSLDERGPIGIREELGLIILYKQDSCYTHSSHAHPFQSKAGRTLKQSRAIIVVASWYLTRPWQSCPHSATLAPCFQGLRFLDCSIRELI